MMPYIIRQYALQISPPDVVCGSGSDVPDQNRGEDLDRALGSRRLLPVAAGVFYRVDAKGDLAVKAHHR